jgi:hypothetical protein
MTVKLKGTTFHNVTIKYSNFTYNETDIYHKKIYRNDVLVGYINRWKNTFNPNDKNRYYYEVTTRCSTTLKTLKTIKKAEEFAKCFVQIGHLDIALQEAFKEKRLSILLFSDEHFKN